MLILGISIARKMMRSVKFIFGGILVFLVCFSAAASFAESDVKIGGFDKTFKTHNIMGEIKSVAVLENDNIVVGGFLSTIDDVVSQNLMSFEKDGEFKMFYDVGLGPVQTVYKVFTAPNNRVVITGKFLKIKDKPSAYIAIFDEKGSNMEFSPAPGANGEIYAVEADRDGIWIAGKFTAFNRKNRTKICRIDYNGALDKCFNPDIKISGEVYTLHFFNEVLFVGGYFGGAGPCVEIKTTHKSLGRLLWPKTKRAFFDSPFNHCGANGKILKVVSQGNNHLLVVGRFSGYAAGKESNIRTGALVRVNATTGMLDKSFKVSPMYIDGTINDVLVHPKDGKIIIVGRFTMVGGIKCNRVARLNPDGSVDPTFDSKIGADHEVLSVAVQKSGNLIIGGSFRNYDGVKCDGLARINY